MQCVPFSHEQQDFPPDEEQQDPFAMREEPSTAILLLLTSNGSTSRKSLIVGHTGVASPPAGRGWMEKCGANLLSRRSWVVDAGIATEQEDYMVEMEMN